VTPAQRPAADRKASARKDLEHEGSFSIHSSYKANLRIL
jgi:hypothetical protein